MATANESARWYTSRRFRLLAMGLLAAVVLGEGYLAIFVRENDFVFHRGLGQAFLTGHPYARSGDWYPLGRVLMNSGLAAMNLYVARAICYTVALAGLVACFQIWRRVGNLSGKEKCATTFAAAVLTLAITLPLVLRDLDECGLQLLMLLFLSAAGLAIFHKHAAWAGFWLATAATYKVTPLLFGPYLLWKRQWRAAAWMGLFVVLWGIAPALFIGWDEMVQCQQQWFGRMQRLSAAGEAYPSLLEAEAPKVQNLSLAAALARYLETYPPGHPLYLDHPWFHQFGHFDPQTASKIVKGLMLALVALVAWRFRRPCREGTRDLAVEWATICSLCALLAPHCWKQHLVVVLPSVFLSCCGLLNDVRVPRWRWIALGSAAAVLLLSRHGIVGRDVSILLMSYKVDTMAILVTLGLVMTLPRLAPIEVASPATTLRGPARKGASGYASASFRS